MQTSLLGKCCRSKTMWIYVAYRFLTPWCKHFVFIFVFSTTLPEDCRGGFVHIFLGFVQSSFFIKKPDIESKRDQTWKKLLVCPNSCVNRATPYVQFRGEVLLWGSPFSCARIVHTNGEFTLGAICRRAHPLTLPFNFQSYTVGLRGLTVM